MIINKIGNVLDHPIVAHQVNDKRVMGAGLALQIKQRYPKVFQEYRNAPIKYGDYLITSDKGKIIINCYTQRGLSKYYKTTDYTLIEKCFTKLKEDLVRNNIKQLAIPHNYGCGLAGGDWNIVSKIFKQIFNDDKVDLIICKL